MTSEIDHKKDSAFILLSILRCFSREISNYDMRKPKLVLVKRLMERFHGEQLR